MEAAKSYKDDAYKAQMSARDLKAEQLRKQYELKRKEDGIKKRQNQIGEFLNVKLILF